MAENDDSAELEKIHKQLQDQSTKLQAELDKHSKVESKAKAALKAAKDLNEFLK